MLFAARNMRRAMVGYLVLMAFSACHDGTSESSDKTAAQSDTTPLSLASPVRIDTRSDDALVVSDAYQQVVHIVDKTTLQVLQSIRIDGEPCGVAVFGEGVLVGNLTTQSIEYYPLSGAEHSTFASGTGRPTSIAVDTAGDRVFVLDGAARVVRVFDGSGAHLTDIPGTGEATTLVHPSALMFHAPSDEVWISDFGDPGSSVPAYVKIYAVDGSFLREISGEGENVGGWFSPEYVNGFSRPQGLAVVDGTLYVTDSLLGRVLAFDADTGAYLASLGTFGLAPGELCLPLDIVADGSGDLIVTSNGNASLVVLSTGGAP